MVREPQILQQLLTHALEVQGLEPLPTLPQPPLSCSLPTKAIFFRCKDTSPFLEQASTAASS